MAADEDKRLILRVSYDGLIERSRKFESSSSCIPKRSQHKFDGYRTPGGYGNTGRGSEHEYMKERSEKEMSVAKSGRRQCKVNIEDLRSEWTKHSNAVEGILSKWSGSLEEVQTIERKCCALEELCQKIVSQDWGLAFQEDLITQLWRSAHYPVSEKLRRQIRRMPTGEDKEALSRSLISFLDSGSKLYSVLVKIIQRAANFQLSEMMDGKFDYSSKSHQKKVKLCVFVCHFCYICMGDLCRYREELKDRPDWSKPRSCYLKAQQLVPRDGKPYNQLAVIAIHAHRRLDVVYYYMRSLTAKNPFLSAYDSLMGLFDETSRKAKALEEKEKTEKEAKRKRREAKPKSKGSRKRRKEDRVRGRVEMWILPGREMEEVGCESTFEEDAELGVDVEVKEKMVELDIGELSRMLTQTFLITQGKLFSKIGIETFPLVLDKLVSLWEAYLKNDLSLVSDAAKILKMVAIGIFSIHNTDNTCGDTTNNSFYSGLSLSVNLHLVSHLLQSASDHVQKLASFSSEGVVPVSAPNSASVGALETPSIVKEDSSLLVERFPHLSPQDSSVATAFPSLSLELANVLDYLAILLPAVHLWLEWTAAQMDIWTSLALSPNMVPIFAKFWKQLALFLNSCQELLPLGLPVPAHATTPCSLLWEDRMLAGFTHLPSLPSSFDDTMIIPDLTQLSPEHIRLQSLCRVGLMIHTALTLCEVSSTATSMVCLCRDGNKRFFVKEPAASKPTVVTVESNPSSDEEEGDDRIVSTPASDIRASHSLDEAVDAVTGGIQQLRLEKERLEEELRLQNQKEETALHVLEDVEKKEVTKVIVRPRYLVPDTNCFVDMLKYIKALVESTMFVVAVPLTVVAELEGLGKGSIEGDDSRNENTDRSAREAVEYIQSQMANKCTHVKVLTTQGNLLASLAFRAELTDKATNDDLILEASLCLHARVDARAGRTTVGGTEPHPHPFPCEEHSVVLLTDDRNLRVKAYASHLPVRSMESFLELVSLT